MNICSDDMFIKIITLAMFMSIRYTLATVYVLDK